MNTALIETYIGESNRGTIVYDCGTHWIYKTADADGSFVKARGTRFDTEDEARAHMNFMRVWLVAVKMNWGFTYGGIQNAIEENGDRCWTRVVYQLGKAQSNQRLANC